MQVAFSALTAIPGLMGGTETYAREVLRGLQRECPEVELTVIANSMSAPVFREFGGKDLSIKQVDSYPASRSNGRRFAAMAGAAVYPGKIAREVDGTFDVIHYPFTVPLPRLPDMPSVVSLHDVQHVELPKMFSLAERTYRRLAYGAAAKRATRVTTLSHASKEGIVNAYGVDPEKIDVIYMGVDHDRFGRIPLHYEAARRAALDLPERFIFYPANLWPHKNHANLLAGLGRSRERPTLVLTGATYGREDELFAQAERYGVRDLVRHLGFVDHDDLPVIYRAATALVFPSLFEGFGVPPAEAMASGCPVATSPAGSLAEVCGEHATYFDPHQPDSIAAAIDQICDRTSPAQIDEAAKWAAQFTWKAAARRHAELYSRAIAAAA